MKDSQVPIKPILPRKKYKIGTHDDTKTELFGVLMLLADIRSAAGDPNGKLMQDEL